MKFVQGVNPQMMRTSNIQCRRACFWNKQCTATPSSDNNNTEIFDYILLKKSCIISNQLLLMKTWTDIVFNLNFNTNMECFFT